MLICLCFEYVIIANMLAEVYAIHARQRKQQICLPEAEAVRAACLGAAFARAADLVANWDPTELSKNPPPEEALVGADCLGAGDAFLRDSLLLAKWEPTELSKNPPPEEAFVGAACLGAAFLGDSARFAKWAPTLLSKKPFALPTAQLLVDRIPCQFRFFASSSQQTTHKVRSSICISSS